MEPKTESVLDEAAKVVAGDRRKSYGPVLESFERIGLMWSAILSRGHGQVFVGPRDVARMMMAMKIARDCHADKRDNLVDIAGYALCAELIDLAQAEEERCYEKICKVLTEDTANKQPDSHQ